MRACMHHVANVFGVMDYCNTIPLSIKISHPAFLRMFYTRTRLGFQSHYLKVAGFKVDIYGFIIKLLGFESDVAY